MALDNQPAGINHQNSDQNFHFGPGTVTVYIGTAPNTVSFHREPRSSSPAAGALGGGGMPDPKKVVHDGVLHYCKEM